MIKVVVVGDPSVGKTSLVLRLSTGSFPSSPLDDVDLASKGYRVFELNLNDDKFNNLVEVWDASSRFLESLHNRVVLYQQAQFALIVYDSTRLETFQNACSRWLYEIRQNIPDATAILIGCKNDLSDRRVPIKEAETFCSQNELFFMEVSALQDTNISLMKRILRIRISHLLKTQSLSAEFLRQQQEHQQLLLQKQREQQHTMLLLQKQQQLKQQLAASKPVQLPSTPPMEHAENGSLVTAFSANIPLSPTSPLAGGSTSTGVQDDNARATARRTNDQEIFNNSNNNSTSNRRRCSSLPVRSVEQSPTISGLDMPMKLDPQQLGDKEDDGEVVDNDDFAHQAMLSPINLDFFRSVTNNTTDVDDVGPYKGEHFLINLNALAGGKDSSATSEKPSLKRTKRSQTVTVTQKIETKPAHTPKQQQQQQLPTGRFKTFEETKNGHLVPVVETDLLMAPSAASASGSNNSTVGGYPVVRHAAFLYKSGAQKKDPRIFIDINIGDGRTGQIGVREGDNAYQLAEMFVRAYYLDRKYIKKLALLIKAKVEEYARKSFQRSAAERRRADTQNATSTSIKPFKLQTAERAQLRAQNDTILKLHIDTGSGKFGTIAVRKGDDPHELAQNFVNTFSLKRSLVDEIASKINEQLISYYTEPSPLSQSPPHSHSHPQHQPHMQSSSVVVTPQSQPVSRYQQQQQSRQAQQQKQQQQQQDFIAHNINAVSNPPPPQAENNAVAVSTKQKIQQQQQQQQPLQPPQPVASSSNGSRNININSNSNSNSNHSRSNKADAHYSSNSNMANGTTPQQRYVNNADDDDIMNFDYEHFERLSRSQPPLASSAQHQHQHQHQQPASLLERQQQQQQQQQQMSTNTTTNNNNNNSTSSNNSNNNHHSSNNNHSTSSYTTTTTTATTNNYNNKNQNHISSSQQQHQHNNNNNNNNNNGGGALGHSSSNGHSSNNHAADIPRTLLNNFMALELRGGGGGAAAAEGMGVMMQPPPSTSPSLMGVSSVAAPATAVAQFSPPAADHQSTQQQQQQAVITADTPRSSSSSSKTLFHIEIDIGNGRKGRLRITKGSDPAVLAQQFALEHDLPQHAQAKLKQIIEQNIVKYQSRRSTPMPPQQQQQEQQPNTPLPPSQHNQQMMMMQQQVMHTHQRASG